MRPSTAQGTRRNWATLALVALGVSVFLTFHIWTLSPTHATTCSCSDASLTAWYLEWPWAALLHGHAPWFSPAMFVPRGTNLLSNTGYLLLGIISLPLTALAGPFASLNFWVTIGPVFGVLTMTRLAQRVTPRFASAAVAGLFYGFAPLVVYGTAFGHLNQTIVGFVPLIAGSWWSYLESPSRRGSLTLALWFVLEFFISTEIFVVAIMGSLVLVTIVRYVGAVGREHSIRRLVVLLLPGGAVGLLTLAVPAYYALYGPSSYQGPIWGGSLSSTSLADVVATSTHYTTWWGRHHFFYLSPAFIAPGLFVVMAWLAFRHAHRLVAVALSITAAGVWLTLGSWYWFSAWHWIGKIGPLSSLVNQRFAVIEMLGVALVVAIAVDVLRDRQPGIRGVAVTSIATSLVLAPYLFNLLGDGPLRAQKIWTPTWFSVHEKNLTAHDVVLAFPFFNTSANYLAVQALDHMNFSVVGGTTPQWLPRRQGPAQPGYQAIWNMNDQTTSPTHPYHATTDEIRDVRRALAYWHVTDVVIPFVVGPTTSRATRAPLTVALWMVDILGPAHQQDGAWVWHFARGYHLEQMH